MDIINILEIIGICAFAISGAIVAINNKYDIMGVIILGVINAMGGGIIRDIVLGITPPYFFNSYNIAYIILSISMSLIVFILACYKKISFYILSINKNNFFYIIDAIGFSAFCIIGANAAIDISMHNGLLLIICVGSLTGLGGGVLRDILTVNIPLIFRKKLYITPVILGITLYYFLSKIMLLHIAMLIAVLFIFIFRCLAIFFKWNLPTIKL